MYRRLFVIILIFFASSALHAAHEISTKGYALLLLGNDALATETGWTNHADTGRLINYGKSRNMTLVDDARPVSNGKASFISAPGVTFMVNGFAPQKTYYLWIDFVRFSYKKNPGIYSKLMIFVDGRQVDELTWGEIDTDSLYKVELPLDLTYDGDVSITFKEKAMNYGYWGVWDIIIASGDLPQGSYFEEDVKAMIDVANVEAGMSERETSPEREAVPSDGNPNPQTVEPVQPQREQSAPQTQRPRQQQSTPQRTTRPSTRSRTTPRRTTPEPQRTEPDVPVVDEPVEPLVDDVNVDSPEIPDEPQIR